MLAESLSYQHTRTVVIGAVGLFTPSGSYANSIDNQTLQNPTITVSIIREQHAAENTPSYGVIFAFRIVPLMQLQPSYHPPLSSI
jgi:hypothetical protein